MHKSLVSILKPYCVLHRCLSVYNKGMLGVNCYFFMLSPNRFGLLFTLKIMCHTANISHVGVNFCHSSAQFILNIAKKKKSVVLILQNRLLWRAFTWHLFWKCKIIIYSISTSGSVTLHALSSHNMSAESIREKHVLHLDLWAACSSFICFAENNNFLCPCKQLPAAVTFLQIELLLLFHFFSHPLILSFPRARVFVIMSQRPGPGVSAELRLYSLRVSPPVLLLLVLFFSVVHYCKRTGSFCQQCWWYNKWQEWVLQHECCT